MRTSRVVVIGLLSIFGLAALFVAAASAMLGGWSFSGIFVVISVICGSLGLASAWAIHSLLREEAANAPSGSARDDDGLVWVNLLRIVVVGVFLQSVWQLFSMRQYLSNAPPATMASWALPLLAPPSLLALTVFSRPAAAGLALGYYAAQIVASTYFLVKRMSEAPVYGSNFEWFVPSVAPLLVICFAAWQLQKRLPESQSFAISLAVGAVVKGGSYFLLAALR